MYHPLPKGAPLTRAAFAEAHARAGFHLICQISPVAHHVCPLEESQVILSTAVFPLLSPSRRSRLQPNEYKSLRHADSTN